MRDSYPRRRFFQGAGVTLVGGSAVFLSACGDDEEEVITSAGIEGTGGDVGILNSVLALELTAIEAYTTGAALLKGPVLAAAEQFLAHEQEHANSLTKAINQLGGNADAKPMKLDLSGLRSQTGVLELAIDLENAAIAAYVDAVPKLSTGDLRATAAQIVVNEAEHVSVLQQALGAPPVPTAFVTGARLVTPEGNGAEP
jgi:bacterioferritin (cytochrome b1)